MIPSYLIIAGIFCTTAVCLRYGLGRSWFCSCSRLKVYSTACSHLICPWSITHVLHGVVFYILAAKALGQGHDLTTAIIIAVAVEGIWEVFENTSAVIGWWKTHGGNPFGDSVVNSMGDMVCCLLGATASHFLSAWVLASILAPAMLVFAVWKAKHRRRRA